LGPTWHYLYFTSFSELAAPKFLAKNHTTSKEMENRKKKRKTEETPRKKWKTFYTLDSGHIHKRTLSFVAGKNHRTTQARPKSSKNTKP
jgi:hypothetical protein